MTPDEQIAEWRKRGLVVAEGPGVRLPAPSPADPASEKEFQQDVTDRAEQLGWEWYHTRDSRRSKAGYPDLTLVHPGLGALVFAELKVGDNRPSAAQLNWVEWLSAVRAVSARVWTPAMWDEIEGVLRGGTPAPRPS